MPPKDDQKATATKRAKAAAAKNTTTNEPGEGIADTPKERGKMPQVVDPDTDINELAVGKIEWNQDANVLMLSMMVKQRGGAITNEEWKAIAAKHGGCFRGQARICGVRPIPCINFITF